MRSNDPTPTRTRPASRIVRRLAATAAVGALAVGLAACAPASSSPASAAASPAIQHRLDALTKQGFPGVLAEVRSADGHAADYVAGVDRLGSTKKPPVDGHVRIGSNTKVFTSTVVLQLVGEGKVSLDAPVERYLPGLLRGDGIDGRRITVRQLLQHTSGLPDYDDVVLTKDFFRAGQQHRYLDPRDLVDAALTKKALFEPGTAWRYSNTNYVVAGLLVQKVTGRPIGEEITHRIIDPLHLSGTSFPAPGDQRIPAPHPEGYWAGPTGGTTLHDVSVTDPSAGWAAGQIISTPSDLTRFFRGLLDGRLLKPAQLKAMQTTVAAPGSSLRGMERYGLGLQTFHLSCGGTAWTHGGDIQGFETRQAFASDGRSAVVAVTSLPGGAAQEKAVENTVDFAVCHAPRS